MKSEKSNRSGMPIWRKERMLMVLGIFNIVYFFFGLALGWGVYFGMLVMALIGIALVTGTIASSYIDKGVLSTRFRPVLRVCSMLFLVFFITFIAFTGMILYSAYFEDNHDAEYVVILGAGLVGEYPSLELKERMDRSLEYINTNPHVKKVVLSGGQGAGEVISEAEAMRRYLIDKGVDKNLLIKEEKSTNTYENIKFTKEILDKLNGNNNIRLAIATNDFHIFRAKLIAKRFEIVSYGISARTPIYIIPNHYVREYFAIIKTLFFDTV